MPNLAQLRSRAAVLAAGFALASGLSACVTAPPASQYRAPQPASAVDARRLYSGRWLEIARLPMGLTNGCVAGTTSYTLTGTTTLDLRDTCQDKTPTGKEKALGAKAVILDPGTNAKFRARYFGGLITWEFWILDHDADYTWFISADPTFDRVWIYTRTAPTPVQLAGLVSRVRALGYDADRLEFPPPLPN
ncbi:lipocalin family protein [soil metagenome]